MNIQILTRLNPKASSWDIGGGGEFSPQDIAAACSGCNELGINILFTQINDDDSARYKALNKLYLKVIDLSNKKKWPTVPENKGKERIRMLTEIALDEVTRMPVCPKCEGSGYSKKDPSQSCGSCGGQGRKHIAATHYAKRMGIDRTTWRDSWSDKYRDVITLIQEYRYIAIKEFNNNLK